MQARLLQATAFIEFGLMDRAWARLKDLNETGEGGQESLRLTATMFVRRGWPSKARPALQVALAEDPNDDNLQVLWEQATRPPEEFDDSRADDLTAPLDVLLPIADRYMATGTFLKARKLLERLRRQHPDSRRVQDLLWALDGDFAFTEGDSLAVLTDRYGPDLAFLADADFTEDVDHTEAVSRSDLPLDEHESRAFPSLFRDLDPVTEEYEGEPEVTQLSTMANLRKDDDNTNPSMPLMPAPPTDVQGGDTQILTVINQELQASSGPIHKANPDADTAISPGFDLAEFRREMGMKAVSDLDGLEEEDEELIVLTKREDNDIGKRDPSTDINLLDLDDATEGINPDEHIPGLGPETPDDFDIPMASETPTMVIEDPYRETPPKKKPKRRSSGLAWWGLALAALVVFGAFLVLSAVLLSFLV